MMNKSKNLRFISFSFVFAAFLLVAGNFSAVNAQRDPFEKQSWAKPKPPAPPPGSTPAKDAGKNKSGAPSNTPTKTAPPAPSIVAAPPIQQRLEYYKRLREMAVMNNQPIPKVTTVLTLDEMTVSGIFRTPRGYAAIVEAKPIKLSYSIYPGEKFFDGQLVAIEENKLVFRRVSKWSNGKFVASEENKPLRVYTLEQEVNGTAPVETTTAAKTEPQPNAPVEKAENKTPTSVPATTVVVSPLEEMMRQPPTADKPKDSAKEKLDKKGNPTAKKPVKIAGNKKQK